MLRRSLASVAVVLAAGLALGGCAVHDSTGRLSVTLSSDAASGRNYSVNVFDAQGQRVEQQWVFAGKKVTFAGVPLGRVTVKSVGFCTEHTTVGYGSTAAVALAVGCTG